MKGKLVWIGSTGVAVETKRKGARYEGGIDEGMKGTRMETKDSDSEPTCRGGKAWKRKAMPGKGTETQGAVAGLDSWWNRKGKAQDMLDFDIRSVNRLVVHAAWVVPGCVSSNRPKDGDLGPGKSSPRLPGGKTSVGLMLFSSRSGSQ